MEPNLYNLIAALVGCAVGLVVASYATWMGMTSRFAKITSESASTIATLTERASSIPTLEGRVLDRELQLAQHGQEISTLREQISRVGALLEQLQSEAARLRGELETERARREASERLASDKENELTELRTRSQEELRQTKERVEFLQKTTEDARVAMSNQFKALANEILEEKSQRFTKLNKENIDQVLTPLRDRLADFKNKVEQIHHEDAQQHAQLKSELAHLKEMNQKMTDEAHSLATALKGEAKTQGNWGEMILDNVLQRSGLREGIDYEREVSIRGEDGHRRPDVIINLPQGKHLIIDAKVSLNAYTRYVNAEDDASRQLALREHAAAVASRIQDLSSKEYFDLPGLSTPEMVFMFIPVESAFVAALRADETIFQTAIEKQVLVATPTTLLTSLNIVRQLWRYEDRNKHMADLADRAAKIYRKLATFLTSMESIGEHLDKAKRSYNTAVGQLCSGQGNLINQVKDFETLGVSVRGSLPKTFVERAALELDYVPVPEVDAVGDGEPLPDDPEPPATPEPSSVVNGA